MAGFGEYREAFLASHGVEGRELDINLIKYPGCDVIRTKHNIYIYIYTSNMTKIVYRYMDKYYPKIGIFGYMMIHVCIYTYNYI